MKKTITSLLLVWAIGSCGTSFLQAQTAVEKGLKSINRPSAEAIVGFLADDALQGREAGMIGSRVAARYLVSCLQEAGIAPLYDDSYYQPFEACAKERQQKGRWQVHPDSIAQLKQGTHRSLRMANVLGMIPGERTNEYAPTPWTTGDWMRSLSAVRLKARMARYTSRVAPTVKNR